MNIGFTPPFATVAKGLKILLLATAFCLPVNVISATTKSSIPLGNPKAPKGGTLYLSLNSEPHTLNPITAEDGYSAIIQEKIMDSLLIRNLQTMQWEYALAERVKKAEDGLSFTFYLRQGALWSDGQPVTPRDVKFSYTSVISGKYSTAQRLPYYENIKSVEVLSDSGIRFNVKQKYFGNYGVIANMKIVPYHFYKDPKKKLNGVILGSGPYFLHKYQKGKAIVLKRNTKWWGNTLPFFKGKHNFHSIHYRFIRDANLRLAKFRKGKLDYIDLTPAQFAKQTTGPLWGSKIKSSKVENSSVKGYSFIGWNHNKVFFKTRETRVALSQLINRQLMNQKFHYNLSQLATGPWYPQSPYADPTIKPIPFKPIQAQKSLHANGWVDSDKDGILDKLIHSKRIKFEFDIIYAHSENEKYLTLIKEDFRHSGIIVHLQKLEWSTFVKAIDEHAFDAIFLKWGPPNLDNDPKQIWHSSSNQKGGGSNFINYKNTKVDRMIETARQELNREKRIKLYKKIYAAIAGDAPYSFMFVEKYHLFGYNTRLNFIDRTYKYGIGLNYWWFRK